MNGAALAAPLAQQEKRANVETLAAQWKQLARALSPARSSEAAPPSRRRDSSEAETPARAATLDVCPDCKRGEHSSWPMICCDDCEQWWHFRCVGLASAAAVPAYWSCPTCDGATPEAAAVTALKRSMEQLTSDEPRLVSQQRTCNIDDCSTAEFNPEELRKHVIGHLAAMAAHTAPSAAFFCPWRNCETSCVNRGNLQRHIERVHCAMRWECVWCHSEHDRRAKAATCCDGALDAQLPVPPAMVKRKKRRSLSTDEDRESFALESPLDQHGDHSALLSVVAAREPILATSETRCGMRGCRYVAEFGTGLEMRMHLREHYEPQASTMGFVCEWGECGAVCSNKGSLQHHIERQHCGMVWECTACGRRAKEKTDAVDCCSQ